MKRGNGEKRKIEIKGNIRWEMLIKLMIENILPVTFWMNGNPRFEMCLWRAVPNEFFTLFFLHVLCAFRCRFRVQCSARVPPPVLHSCFLVPLSPNQPARDIFASRQPCHLTPAAWWGLAAQARVARVGGYRWSGWKTHQRIQKQHRKKKKGGDWSVRVRWRKPWRERVRREWDGKRGAREMVREWELGREEIERKTKQKC